MKRKKIIFIINLVCFSCMTRSMDDPVADPNPQLIVEITDDLSTKKNNQKKKPPVSNIIITASQGSSSHNLIKTRVQSIKELQDQIKETQHTQRSARSSAHHPIRARTHVINSDDVAVTNTQIVDDTSLTRNKKSFLPTTLQHLIGKSLDNDHEKTYTEDEVWALMAPCNRVLHDFGKKYNLELEDLEVFAACMERLAINPELITEYVNFANDKPKPKGWVQGVMAYVFGDPHEQHLENIHKEYEKMGNGTEAERYKAMLLELIKTAADQAEGKQTHRSAIADTHTALQNRAIADQATQIRLQYMGLILTLFTAAGGWAFGVVGQYINPGNCTR